MVFGNGSVMELSGDVVVLGAVLVVFLRVGFGIVVYLSFEGEIDPI